MELDVKRIWSSPSTIHLQCVLWGKQKKWMKFVNIHIPMSEIPSEVRRDIALSEDLDFKRPLPEDPSLF